MKAFLLLPVLFFYACSEKYSSLSPEQKNTISKEVRQTLADYYSDIQKEGLLAEFKYLDSSADFFWVPPGFTYPLSFDSVATILRTNAPSYRSVVNSWDSLQIFPVSGALVTYSGKLHSTATDTSGKTYETALVESGVIIKRKGKWKLLCGQTSVINR